MSTSYDYSSCKTKPLKTVEEIEDFLHALRTCAEHKYILICRIGIETGLKVPQILKLKVGHLRTKRIVLYVKENKKREVVLSEQLYNELKNFTHLKEEEDYLFTSRKSKRKLGCKIVYNTISKAAKILEREDIGACTLSKTYVYMKFKKGESLYQLKAEYRFVSLDKLKQYLDIA